MIHIKSSRELDLMRASGRLAAACMDEIIRHIKPGVTTKELDVIAEEFIRDAGAVPSFKNYRGFPAAICSSINGDVVHGIPGNIMLNDGDIIGIDFGALLNGYHSDMARTVGVGEISKEAKHLIDVTKECFYAGMNKAKAGNRLKDISLAVEKKAHENGYTVVHELVGHGIGKHLHEEPDVPNYVFKGANPRLRSGMVICIEPMVNAGERYIGWGDDGWRVFTLDGSLSAHYENTVAITDRGPEILTVA